MASELSQVGRKSAAIFAGNLISRPFNFIFGIAVGRLLGAEIYGEFIFVVSFLAMFVTLSGAGLTNGIIAFLPGQKTRDMQKSLSSYVVSVIAIASLLVGGLLYLFSDLVADKLLNNTNLLPILLMLIPTIVLLSLEHILLAVMRANGRIKEHVFIRNIFIPSSKLILLLVFTLGFNIQNKYSLIVPYYIYSTGSIIYLCAKMKKYDYLGRIEKHKVNKDILVFSLPLLFSGVIGILTTNIDQYMIGYLLNAREVGIYKVAIQFATLTSFAFISLNTAFAPSIAKLYHEGKMEEMADIYKKSTKWVTVINLLIFGIFFVLSQDLMRLVGKEFLPGASVLVIISLGEIINSASGPVGAINIQTGHPRYTLYTKLIVLVVNVSLNALLIPTQGIKGAAFATMTSIMLSNIVAFLLMYRQLKIHPYDKSYLKIIFSMLLATSISFLLHQQLDVHYMVRIMMICAIYTLIYGTLMMTWIIDRTEIKMMTDMIKTLKKKTRNN
ncbi:MAG: flippase [Tissierellales bacterium]|nr:flippase [Tissierellales bacterium]MBN2826685.1 flippase [Tissierellales bacterium]